MENLLLLIRLGYPYVVDALFALCKVQLFGKVANAIYLLRLTLVPRARRGAPNPAGHL